MKVRRIAALVLAVQALTGCTGEFQIPVTEIPQLKIGSSVQTVDGGEKRVARDYSVALVPHDGAVFVRPDQASPRVVAVPQHETELPPADRFLRSPWLQGPIQAQVSGPYLFLIGTNDSIAALPGSVKALKIRQISAGKTAALVLGCLAGAAAVGFLAWSFADLRAGNN